MYLGTPKGHQQITALSSSTALTVPAGARVAVVVCQTQNVRWRDDGTNPTTSVGMLMKTTDPPLQLPTTSLGAVRFIETTASAALNIAYYG